ncbi:MAG: membrane protein insertase YidC [Pseudomonadota bacterium]
MMNPTDDQKNMLYFVILIFGVMFAWQYFFDVPQTPTIQTTEQQSTVTPSLPSELATLEAIPQIKSRTEALAVTPRLKIKTARLKGSINLKGARIDDLMLLDYREGTQPDSPHIVLFSPEHTADPYGARFGWVAGSESIKVPDANSIWSADVSKITDNNQAATLTWDNGAGVQFVQEVSVDANYLFSVKQKVINKTSVPLKLLSYGRITRIGTPKTAGYMVLHEGPIGFIDDHLEEYDYGDLTDKKEMRFKGQGGWIGFTDKYWLSAFIPDQQQNFEFFFQGQTAGQLNHYVAGYYGQLKEIAPGEAMEVTHNLFSGAKVLDILDAYEEKLGVHHFDKAVDFGWFYIITKPLFYVLDYTYRWVGNFGVAILILTVLLKLLFFPLANKSYRSMGKMKQLQPKMEKLKERYADDKMKLNQELMAFYKKEKVNPMAGCLPMIIQIPVFFALYKVLFVSIEMRHAPFFGWIHDLSAPDPTTFFNLFGVIPWDPPSFLMIGAWPIIMGATMLIQQKLNPAPADPIQAKMFLLMPIMFTVMLAQFPVGLVIYWSWSNVLSIGQQWVMMRSVKKAS